MPVPLRLKPATWKPNFARFHCYQNSLTQIMGLAMTWIIYFCQMDAPLSC